MLATLMICREVEALSANMFRPRAVTVIRSRLSTKDIATALSVICPKDLYLMQGGFRSGDKGKAVHYRGLRRKGLYEPDIEEIAALISIGERIIFLDDMGAEDADDDAPFPPVPCEVITLRPIDAEVIAILLAIAFPGTPPEISSAALALLPSSEGCHQLTSRDVVCATCAADYNGAIQHLLAQLSHEDEKLEVDVPAVAKPVAPLERLVGYGGAIQAAQDMLSALRLHSEGKISWEDVPRGMLLIGAPGTGKTELARAMAHSLGISFMPVSYSKWQSKGHLGDMQRDMARDFEKAIQRAPCLMLIDEMDAFRASASGHNSSYDDKVVKSLIEHLDGIKGREGVVIVGTANDLEKIPAVIWRSGRFDEVIHIPLPTREELAIILQQHLKAEDGEIDTEACSVHALGQTGADCAAALRRARAAARRHNRAITTSDVIGALNGDLRHVNPDMLWRMAVHECGHALVASSYPELTVNFLRLTGTGGFCHVCGYGGLHTAFMLQRDRAIMLAGRMAEILVLGAPSSGSGGEIDSDLGNAMMSAANQIGAYGLGQLGPIWLGAHNTGNLLREVMNGNLPEVAEMISEAGETARQLLEPQISRLTEMAQALAETGVLTGQRLAHFLPPPPACEDP
ncbi:AAA family ATPase [Tropicibacter oceani]|uniref:AAA family ATPase n=1 Tax=Tropicibacter oceani TaxID=3058420 RepID=A0ABY8QL11_9RHOB|nr:AAA family ATPase [Tropicibacter oceani]WGW05325.1 AAA family ATPase [Tropicibacter oceani]